MKVHKKRKYDVHEYIDEYIEMHYHPNETHLSTPSGPFLIVRDDR